MLSFWFKPISVAHPKKRHGLPLGHGPPVENHCVRGISRSTIYFNQWQGIDRTKTLFRTYFRYW